MKHTALNTANLRQLWQLAGMTSGEFNETGGYSTAIVENADWPNRIWANGSLSEDVVRGIKSEMMAKEQLVFSHVNTGNEETNELLKPRFKLKSRQYGMSLPLDGKYRLKLNVSLERVRDVSSAKQWSNTFKDAFRYRISEETIIKTNDSIEYYLVKKDKILVGTVVLLLSNNSIGVHSLGIIPAERKKGYGKEIMYAVLNRAIDRNCDYATLQASDMAKNMYSELGFSLDFIMENYTLK